MISQRTLQEFKDIWLKEKQSLNQYSVLAGNILCKTPAIVAGEVYF